MKRIVKGKIMKEVILWSGTPSQYLNVNYYLSLFILIVVGIFLPLAFVLLPIALVVVIWNYLVLKKTKYELTNERLKIYTGVINKHINDLELYRVKDTRLYEPWNYRIFGLGKIIVLTSDLSSPVVQIKAIKEANDTRELLRTNVEKRRITRGISAVDVV